MRDITDTDVWLHVEHYMRLRALRTTIKALTAVGTMKAGVVTSPTERLNVVSGGFRNAV
jgi:hypothetical protein